MVEPTGYTALDLIGFTDKGPYDPTANYVRNDLVHVGNSTWRCKIDDTTGITPTEGANWTIFIESVTSLAGMSDVDLNTPKAGDGLVHDGNDWTNIPIMTKEQWKNNGAYNDLPMTLVNKVINGATATVNVDGSVTIDTAGSATTGVANFVWDFPSFGKVGTKYRLVGCPSGGGANTYYVNIYDNGWNDGTKDYGSGNTFTLGTGITQAVISIRSGVVVDHLTFKPMITTDLNATYGDYVPHASTNLELTESVVYRKNEPVLLATAAANQTWATQLTSLKTTYDTLTDAQKKRTFIGTSSGYNDQAFANTHTGIGGFGGNICDSTGQILIYAMRMLGALVSRATVSTSGTLTFTNIGTITNPNAMTLWLN